MLVRFWGVRGSTPTPQSENLRYGGNTSCVEVRINGHIYVFDCGTGFRNLGKQLAQEHNGNAISAHIFLSPHGEIGTMWRNVRKKQEGLKSSPRNRNTPSMRLAV